jgi:type I restriction enzyme S subunit
MIGELKPYSAYKDSGVPWLGEVPEHWEIVPLSSIARPRKVTNEGCRDLLSVYLGQGVIPFSSVEEKRTNTTSEDLSKYQLVEPGDFVLNNQQAWRGSVGVSRYTGIVSPAYLVLTLDKRLDRDFADKLFSDRAMVAQYLVCSKGVGSIQRNLYWLHLKRAVTVVPPLHEQTQIATFLDYADRRIRRYIRSKQKLIKLLEEQKQVIINQAVTRGLDPNVPLKSSGIEWLGDIPEHWEIRKLKHLSQQIVDGTHFTPTYIDEGVPFIRVKDIQSPILNLDSLRRISKEEHLTLNKRCNPQKGDLLLSKNGTIGLTRVIDWDFPCSIFVSLCLIKPRFEMIDPQFIAFAFRGGLLAKQLSETTKTTSVTNLHLEKIRDLVIPLPPLDEQQRILTVTAEELRLPEHALRTADREIFLLRQFRTRLIADVVTGKLDVREAAAHLPAELDELEPLEDDLPDPELDLDADSDLEAVAEDEAA